jgi:hypothetical protein
MLPPQNMTQAVAYNPTATDQAQAQCKRYHETSFSQILSHKSWLSQPSQYRNRITAGHFAM